MRLGMSSEPLKNNPTARFAACSVVRGLMTQHHTRFTMRLDSVQPIGPFCGLPTTNEGAGRPRSQTLNRLLLDG
jgi:hypothetical protein